MKVIEHQGQIVIEEASSLRSGVRSKSVEPV